MYGMIKILYFLKFPISLVSLAVLQILKLDIYKNKFALFKI